MKKTLSLVLTMCMVLSLFATFAITASADEAVNLAAGKTYTYPTDNMYFLTWSDEWGVSKNAAAALTDGDKSGNYYGANTMVGWSGIDPVIVIDLGAVASVDTFKYTAYAGMDGISEAASVTIEVSTDNTNWTEVTYTSAQGEKAMSDLSWAATGYTVETTATAAEAVDAQYVRFTYTRTGSFVFLNEIEVWGVEKKAEVALEWKPMFISHFENTTVEGAGVIFTDNAKNTNYAWRIHVVFAPIAGVENAYEIVDIIDYLQSDASKVTKTPVISEGGFAYNLNYGNDYPSINMDGPDYTSPNCNNMIADALTWKVGDKFVFEGLDLEGKTVPTSTPDTNWYDDAYVCTAKYAAYVPGASSAVKETITVDGEVNDTGWAKDKWITVSGENGSWQYPTLKEVAEGTPIPTFTYKFQLRADDAKLYGALVLDGVHEEDKNIKVRVWFRDNDEATRYTSFYDFVLAPDGTLTTLGKYNLALDDNKGCYIGQTDPSVQEYIGSLDAKAVAADGKTVFEFSVDIDEVTADGNFDYFVCLERKQGVNTGTLYYPFVPELNETSPHGNYPWLLWYTENDATVNVEDIVLGEVVVSDKEEADTSMMGTAPAAPAFTVTLDTAEGWVAGEKLVVTATVDILEDIDLSQVMFNLYYDASDVEIVLPEDLGAIITTGKDSWKEDSLFTLKTEGDYGVIECAPATTVEADVLKKGEQLVMTFEFTVKAEAEGLINFQLSNKGLVGYSWDLTAAEAAGAGSSLAVENADELGDTGIYVIAALALVALIGTAVVIKKRA